MSTDPRDAIYQNLHHKQLSKQEATTAHSAKIILQLLREYLQPASLLDVGCGLGSWLRAAQDAGITDVLGLEGPWLDKNSLVVEPNLVQTIDLEKPFHLHRRFDLAICLEVGEHLAPAAAPHLIDSLTNHADCILFSAAIPHQGGHHHVNEKFLSYWIDLFAKVDYVPLDLLRAKIWNDASIHWWLRQNMVLFASQNTINANPKLAAEQNIHRPLSIVHPDVYLMQLQAALRKADEIQKLMNIFNAGGTFEVQPLSQGKLTIRKLK